MTTISVECVKCQQDLRYTRVSKFGDIKLRVTIRRNTYDFQSAAKVELWTPQGWTFVHGIDGCDPVMTVLPNYVTLDMDKAEQQLAEVADMLEGTAMAVVL